MNAEELKSKIVFKTEPLACGATRLIGNLNIRSGLIIDGYCDINRAIEHGKECIRHNIARTIYDDQRSAMFRAIDELYMCSPMDCSGFRKACDKIAALAKYQPNL